MLFFPGIMIDRISKKLRMNPQTKNWLDSATYDLETAESMLQVGRYIYTIFMCHLNIRESVKSKRAGIIRQNSPKNSQPKVSIKIEST